MRNLVQPDEFPYKTGSGIVWDRSGFTECLADACAAIDYDGFRQKQAAARAAGKWLGIGLASYAELTGIGSRISAAPGMPINTGTESATIRIDSSGAVTALFGVASHGQGLETSLAQVVADELGVRDGRCRGGDGRQRHHGARHRHLCQPFNGACRRGCDPVIACRAGKCHQGGIPPARSSGSRYRVRQWSDSTWSAPTAA